LGEQGAEQLLGKGDMLFMSSANRIVRIHGPVVSENEIEKVNSFLRSQANPDYIDEILDFVDEREINANLLDNENKDQLYETAVNLVKSEGKASTSYLQRKLQIGYNRAANLIEEMEKKGIVGEAQGSKPRKVLSCPDNI
jgi:S-DNA-T family DNA segregation ATPase FtsK/SpoIIIE